MMKPVVEVYTDSYSAQNGIQHYLERGYTIADKIIMPNMYHDTYNNNNINTDTHVVVVFTTDDWTAQDRIDELSALHDKKVSKLDKQIYKKKEELKEIKKANREWENINDSLSFKNKNLEDKMESLQDRIKQAKMLEEDLVKVRNAIGEIQFNQIVGPPSLEEK
jgi:predicted RNase H-like nuclease (RuvC/YqgF family)